MSRSVTFNLELKITVSIGEPYVTIQQPQQQPQQRLVDPNVRSCACCAANYRETATVWPQFPMCPRCVEERHQFAQEYDRELDSRIAEMERRNQEQNPHWKEDGF